MKLRSLHIEDYKVFKDFDIDFLDKDDNPLPIVVLAGVNGSGKTTLLEFLHKPIINMAYFAKEGTYLEIINKNRKFQVNKRKIKEKNIYSSKLDIDKQAQFANGAEMIVQHTPQFYDDVYLLEEKSKNLIYLPTIEDKIENIKETIRQKYIDRAFEIDKPSEALYELQSFISNVFDGLDLTFNLSSIDYNKNIVRFKDNSGKEFDINKLSTGEKTLLLKVLYLFFQDYKNKVILIDEPELSLHPSWQNRVLKIYENFAKMNNCQIIIATHSPHIVGSAKSESLRVLKKVDGKVEVVKYSQSYGFEFDKILTDVMGIQNLRTPDVAKDIKRLWELLEDDDYESEEYQKLYQKLEELLGDLDQDLILARLEIAKIKSRNA